MRKFVMRLLILGGVTVLLVGTIVASTITRLSVYRMHPSDNAVTLNIAADMNDATIPIGSFYGTLTTIELYTANVTADNNDTAFSVVVLDDASASLFAKADCNSCAFPLRYALTETDTTGSNIYRGIPVSGALSVQIADANNADLTDLSVRLYYDRAAIE